MTSNQYIESIKRVYSGINQNDLDPVLEVFDVNVMRIQNFSTVFTCRGRDELRQHLLTGRSAWVEGTCLPVEFIIERDKAVVVVHIKVKLKNNPNWIDSHIADGFSFRKGLVTEFHSFMNKNEALKWAKIS